MVSEIDRKFSGPTFDALVEFSKRNDNSLLNAVAHRSPEELAAIVVGVSVYEVYVDLPECGLLLKAMEKLKRRQKRDPTKLIWWMNQYLPTKKIAPNGKDYVIQSIDMRMFLARVAMSKLPKAVFKPFVPIVKNFLVTKLMRFTNRSKLYEGPPLFPVEKDLPPIVNAIGPMKQLETNYPHLAHMKREMVANITNFTITYCLDWICELLTLKCDYRGNVKYNYPIMKEEPDWDDAINITSDTSANEHACPLRKPKVEADEATCGNHGGKTGTHTLLTGCSLVGKQKKDPRKSRSVPAVLGNAGFRLVLLHEFNLGHTATEALSNVIRAWGDGIASERTVLRWFRKFRNRSLSQIDKDNRRAGTSNAQPSLDGSLSPKEEEQEQQSPLETQQMVTPFPGGVPTLDQSIVHDDWSEMLHMALTDPNLPTHYKTMIHCLVANNRDLRNVIASMKAQRDYYSA